MAWREANNKGPNTNTNNNNNDKRKKLVPHQWCPPTNDEKIKRFIHGKPYTWTRKSSWIKDNTPDSGLESPTAAAMTGKSTNFPTSIDGGDDATALTFLTQDQVSEINRIQANLGNLGTTIGQMTSYLGGLNIKE